MEEFGQKSSISSYQSCYISGCDYLGTFATPEATFGDIHEEYRISRYVLT